MVACLSGREVGYEYRGDRPIRVAAVSRGHLLGPVRGRLRIAPRRGRHGFCSRMVLQRRRAVELGFQHLGGRVDVVAVLLRGKSE